MIHGALINFKKDKFLYSENLEKALEFIKNFNFNDCEEKRYDIDGEKMYMSVSLGVTKPLDDTMLESHGRYIDIHYMIEGEEQLGVALEGSAALEYKNLMETNDAILYSSCENEYSIVIKQGEYAIFNTEELHRPSIAVNGNCIKIKKAIIKISERMI